MGCLIRLLYAAYLAWRNSCDLEEIALWVREGSACGTQIVLATMRINERRDNSRALVNPRLLAVLTVVRDGWREWMRPADAEVVESWADRGMR